MDKATTASRRGIKRRRLIQLYSALLYNANLGGFAKGKIFTGATKTLCVPGLNCYSCPGAVASCPLGSLQNALASSDSSIPKYVIGILLLLGLSLGRTICGWLCPFGFIQELLYKLRTPKLPKSRLTRGLSYLKYLILAVFVIAVPLYWVSARIAVPAFCKYICPSGTLLGAIPLLVHPGNADLRRSLGGLFAIKLTVLILILAGSVFIFRIFCRFLCPLGAIYGLFSRVAIIRVHVDENKCTSCGACMAHCRMDCRKVGDRECISCGECTGVCPVNAITAPVSGFVGPDNDNSKLDRTLRYTLRAAALLLLVAVMLYAAITDHNRSSGASETDSSLSAGGTTTDGPSLSAGETTAGVPLDVFGNPAVLCPDFSINLTDGSTFTPVAAAGKYLIINFWATWCGPCCREMPDFERFALNHPEDVYVLAIHSAFITEDVEAWIDASGYKLNFAIDPDGVYGDILQLGQVLPHTIIISPEGYVIYSMPGAIGYDLLENIIYSLAQK